MQSMSIVHPLQVLLDYPVAFAMMGLGALVRKQSKLGMFKLPVAVLIAALGRYVCAVVSGAVFFAEYAGDMNPWIYSLTYNVSYLSPDALLAMVLALLLHAAGLESIITSSTRRSRAS